ncbi:MAG TPA: sulfurtransferase [Ilumatobacteraceae bacterium]
MDRTIRPVERRGSIGDVMEPVVTVEQMRASLSAVVAGPSVVVADVRWYLDGRSGRAAFEAGHIPGAVFVDLDNDLSGHGQSPTAGRHPFPTPIAFARAMSQLGIGDDTPVIAYDDSGGGTAGRLVWMLRVLGHDAALLDGGLQAWTGDLEQGAGAAPKPGPATFTVRPWPADRFAAADDTAALARADDAVVLDARAADRYRGETEPIDARAGHIPGAANAPWAGNLESTHGRFRAPAELAAHYAQAGARRGSTVVCYCGSGVSACANLLGLERAGIDGARLYVASWSGWSSDPEREVATGA